MLIEEPEAADTIISVIIPAYNHERYIGECIQSIVDQTFEKLELVIVNDGSTDQTHEKILSLLEDHKDRFKKLNYVNREHRGTGATLNELISLAGSEYIFQIASDDVAIPHAINTLFSFLVMNSEYALVVGDNKIINSNSELVYWDLNRNNIMDYSKAIYRTFGEFLKTTRPDAYQDPDTFGSLSTLLKGNYIPNGKMFRRSALEEVGGYREDVLEDWYINIMLAKRYKLKYIDKPLFYYRWHENNSIKNTDYINRLMANMETFLADERIKILKRESRNPGIT